MTVKMDNHDEHGRMDRPVTLDADTALTLIIKKLDSTEEALREHTREFHSFRADVMTDNAALRQHMESRLTKLEQKMAFIGVLAGAALVAGLSAIANLFVTA